MDDGEQETLTEVMVGFGLPPLLPLSPQLESPKQKIIATATEDNVLARNHRMSHLNGALGPFRRPGIFSYLGKGHPRRTTCYRMALSPVP
jgi:hypothetical protein